MGRIAPRGARTIVAAITIAGVALGAVGACTLYSSGLADSGDASMIIPGQDANAPDSPVVVPDANEAASDVIVASDGPDACAPIETDCLDGVDNDCNGQTDCADPACGSGYTCVPTAASGWSGYALYDDGRATACPPAYPTQVDTYEGLLFSPASCTACLCTASGTACGMSSIACASGSCGVALDTFGTACDDFGDPISIDQTSSCSATIPAASGGSCAPSGGSATTSMVNFSKLSRTCGATGGPGGGCGVAHSCVAKAPTGTHGVCVSQLIAGSALCPTDYPHAYIVMPTSTSFTDSRGCSGCSCGGVNGASCTGTATLYPETACTDDSGPGGGGFGDDAGTSIPFPADGVCHASLVGGSAVFESGELQANLASQGSCTPDGGAPTGTVTPMTQTAYCCQN